MRSKNVWWMGFVSLLTDISSEMLFPIIPVFLRSVLGVQMALLGTIEGFAQAAESISKCVAGYATDRWGNKKNTTIFGYGTSTLAKSLLLIAGSWPVVMCMRIGDRLGKGIRTAPRDALIAASAKNRGAAFGLHRTLDTVGAIIGTLAVTALLYVLGESRQAMQTIFKIALVPAILAVILLYLKVSEKPTPNLKQQISFRSFSEELRWFTFASLIFAVTNYSYAFYILRAQDVGVVVFLLPLLYVVHNMVYAAISYPIGKLSDRIGKKNVLTAGFLVMSAVAFGFAFADSTSAMWLLFALYGLFMGIFDAISKAYVSDLAPEQSKGTALGTYAMLVGLVALPANMLGGYAWSVFGHQYAFLLAAIAPIIASCMLWAKVPDGEGKMAFKLQSFRFYR